LTRILFTIIFSESHSNSHVPMMQICLTILRDNLFRTSHWNGHELVLYTVSPRLIDLQGTISLM